MLAAWKPLFERWQVLFPAHGMQNTVQRLMHHQSSHPKHLCLHVAMHAHLHACTRRTVHPLQLPPLCCAAVTPFD